MLTHESSQALAENRRPVVALPARSSVVPRVGLSIRTMPLVLGALYVLASALLTVFDLAQPAPQPDFPGIRFSNTINSPGSRAIVAMYRDHLEWLPRPWSDSPPSPSTYVLGIRIAWLSMILIQIAALWVCKRAVGLRLRDWIFAPVVCCLVLLFYPPTSTDIYAYSSFGWLAEHGANPYMVVPESLPGDPYASFNDWTHVRSPYGPLWTGLTRVIVHFTHEDPFWTTIVFKIVATLPGFLLALLTYKLAKRWTSNERLAQTVFVLIWWSPLMLTEAAATVHLDPTVILLAMLGLAVATGERFRSHRLGVALVTASALVKPISLPLIALLILARAAGRSSWPRAMRDMALDVSTVLAIAMAAYAPFWNPHLLSSMVDNYRILYTHDPLRSNPLWVWGLDHVDAVLHITSLTGGDAGNATRYIAMALTAGVAALLGRAILQQRTISAHSDDAAIAADTFRLLVYAWAAVTVVIGILPVNAHPWYVTWTMPLLALLWISTGTRDRTRPPSWLLALQSWIFLSFWVYHTLPKR